MPNKAIWYSRCSKCGEWVIEGLHFDEEFICVECLHFGIDLDAEDFLNDPDHKDIPVDELFK